MRSPGPDPEAASSAPLPARLAFCDEILNVARTCAGRLDLGDDAEDCALAFVARVLADHEERALRPPATRHLAGTCCRAWLWRCATHYAQDYRRRRHSRWRHEQGWPEVGDGRGDPWAWDCPDGGPPVEGGVLRSEFWRIVDICLSRLDPVPRALFRQHHLEGESIQDLAAWCGRTPHAVEQALLRARLRLRSLLAQQGLAEAELGEWLSPRLSGVSVAGGPPGDGTAGAEKN